MKEIEWKQWRPAQRGASTWGSDVGEVARQQWNSRVETEPVWLDLAVPPLFRPHCHCSTNQQQRRSSVTVEVTEEPGGGTGDPPFPHSHQQLNLLLLNQSRKVKNIMKQIPLVSNIRVAAWSHSNTKPTANNTIGLTYSFVWAPLMWTPSLLLHLSIHCCAAFPQLCGHVTAADPTPTHSRCAHAFSAAFLWSTSPSLLSLSAQLQPLVFCSGFLMLVKELREWWWEEKTEG